MLDITKPVEVYTKTPLVGEGGNYYPPGIYRPGELPAQFLIETCVRNIAVGGSVNLARPTIELKSEPQIPAISKAVDHDLIDINTAEIGIIMKVKGISTVLANTIITERDSKGKFKNIADLIARVEKLVPLTTTVETRFSFS